MHLFEQKFKEYLKEDFESDFKTATEKEKPQLPQRWNEYIFDLAKRVKIEKNDKDIVKSLTDESGGKTFWYEWRDILNPDKSEYDEEQKILVFRIISEPFQDELSLEVVLKNGKKDLSPNILFSRYLKDLKVDSIEKVKKAVADFEEYINNSKSYSIKL
mgnify:CR=1 FL=1